MIISISSFESQSNKNHVKFSRYKKLIYIIEAFDTLILFIIPVKGSHGVVDFLDF